MTAADPIEQTDAPRPPRFAAGADAKGIDLDRIAGELADVEIALGRLADGTYWTDEVSGEELPADVLVASPITRTVVPTDL